MSSPSFRCCGNREASSFLSLRSCFPPAYSALHSRQYKASYSVCFRFSTPNGMDGRIPAGASGCSSSLGPYSASRVPLCRYPSAKSALGGLWVPSSGISVSEGCYFFLPFFGLAGGFFLPFFFGMSVFFLLPLPPSGGGSLFARSL